MAAPAGWRIVKGRARYWDGDQWVGGDFDPATISPQLLAESAGSAAPSVRRAVSSPASPSMTTQTSSPVPSMPTQPTPAQPSKAEAQAQAKASVERWAEDLMSGRLPGAMDPGAGGPPARAAAPPPRSPAPIGASAPKPVKPSPPAGKKGISIGKIIGFVITGWILLNLFGSILSDTLP